jgi:hypothetical protein
MEQTMNKPPKDKTRVLRWHKVFKCIITVFYLENKENNCNWCEATLCTCWPEDAFTDWWCIAPDDPTTADIQNS